MRFVGPPEGLTDEDAAPPLPERTPESYILAVDPGYSQSKSRIHITTRSVFLQCSSKFIFYFFFCGSKGKNECPTEEQNTCKHLSVIIPRNAAADVVRELRGDKMFFKNLNVQNVNF